RPNRIDWPRGAPPLAAIVAFAPPATLPLCGHRRPHRPDHQAFRHTWRLGGAVASCTRLVVGLGTDPETGFHIRGSGATTPIPIERRPGQNAIDLVILQSVPTGFPRARTARGICPCSPCNGNRHNGLV